MINEKIKKRVTITISKDLLTKTQQECKELGLTFSQYIIYLLLKKEEEK